MKIKRLNEELNEDHPIAVRIFQDLDDIEALCQDTYNWDTPEWNDRKNVEQTADLIIQYATDIKDALAEYYDD